MNPDRIDGITRIGRFMYPLFKVHGTFSYFVSLQSPCCSSPCQHEAACVTNYRDGSFGCRYAKGFKGEYCEKGKKVWHGIKYCNSQVTAINIFT